MTEAQLLLKCLTSKETIHLSTHGLGWLYMSYYSRLIVPPTGPLGDRTTFSSCKATQRPE